MLLIHAPKKATIIFIHHTAKSSGTSATCVTHPTKLLEGCGVGGSARVIRHIGWLRHPEIITLRVTKNSYTICVFCFKIKILYKIPTLFISSSLDCCIVVTFILAAIKAITAVIYGHNISVMSMSEFLTFKSILSMCQFCLRAKTRIKFDKINIITCIFNVHLT